MMSSLRGQGNGSKRWTQHDRRTIQGQLCSPTLSLPCATRYRVNKYAHALAPAVNGPRLSHTCARVDQSTLERRTARTSTVSSTSRVKIGICITNIYSVCHVYVQYFNTSTGQTDRHGLPRCSSPFHHSSSPHPFTQHSLRKEQRTCQGRQHQDQQRWQQRHQCSEQGQTR